MSLELIYQSIDIAFKRYATSKNKSYIHGIMCNYSLPYIESFDEYINLLSYNSFIEYFKDYSFNKFDLFCIFIISLNVYISKNLRHNKKEQECLNLVYFEKDAFSEFITDSESYNNVSSEEIILEKSIYKNEYKDIEEFYNKDTLNIDNIVYKPVKYNTVSDTSIKFKNKILSMIDKSVYREIINFDIKTVNPDIHPFIFYHLSFLRKKENGEYRILSKINLIGAWFSEKLNKLFNILRNSVLESYVKYRSIYQYKENMFQIDIKKAYDNVNHDLLLKMLPDECKSFFKLFIKTPIYFNMKGNRYIKINREKGIPIGSPLSPNLYEIYIDNIFKNNLYWKCENIKDYIRFVDDFRIIFSGDYKELSEMFNKNGLLLNDNKSGKLILSDTFLKYPNDVNVFYYILFNTDSLIKLFPYEEKWKILLNKLLNHNISSIFNIKRYIRGFTPPVIKCELEKEVIFERSKNYILKFFISIESTIYKNIKIYYKKGSTLDNMIRSNNELYLDYYLAVNYLYKKCNICFSYSENYFQCKYNCYTCFDCINKQVLYTKNINCINCNAIINFKNTLNNKKFKKLLQTDYFKFVKDIFNMKLELYHIYTNLLPFQNNDNIGLITSILERTIILDESIILSLELKDILKEYLVIYDKLYLLIEEMLIKNNLSIINLKCKYCNIINRTENKKLFKCECKDIYQCKLCPLEFNDSQEHECLENIKLCPNCRIPINKYTGCDHVKCKACGKEFDFKNPFLLLNISFTPIEYFKNKFIYKHLLMYEQMLNLILNFNINTFDRFIHILIN